MFYNEDCITGSQQHVDDDSVDLGIHDAPFGIKETSFKSLYNRKSENIIDGYVEAPEGSYFDWTLRWMRQARRILKPNGSAYIVSGWTRLGDVIYAAEAAGFHIVNHIVWKYNFGVYTKKKWVTSHYPILYVTKSKKAKPVFNRSCRFRDDERDKKGSLQYRDREDVWVIKREYRPKQKKNSNKLPDALIEKMVLYSSNPGDMICDFFLGNFTTALMARKLKRVACGFELNRTAYDIGMQRLRKEVKEIIRIKS